MKVILKETIESLGIIGSEVNVKKGYARNYLLPQKKAVPATDANRKILEKDRKKVEIQIAKERNLAKDMAERLSEVTCTISAKVRDEGRLYGSVSLNHIVDALADMDIKVEKKMVLLSEAIKETGTYKVPIRVYQGVEPEITVEVVPESQ
ncbi:Large ribosomal subunit protein bL9 [Candidatus Magnetomoraceae bacterium gMMP-15]